MPIPPHFRISQSARLLNLTPGPIFVVWIWIWRLARRFVLHALKEQRGDFAPLTQLSNVGPMSRPSPLVEVPSRTKILSAKPLLQTREKRPLSHAAEFLRERRALRRAPIESLNDLAESQTADQIEPAPNVESARQCVLCDALWSPPPSFSSWRFMHLSQSGKWDLS